MLYPNLADQVPVRNTVASRSASNVWSRLCVHISADRPEVRPSIPQCALRRCRRVRRQQLRGEARHQRAHNSASGDLPDDPCPAATLAATDVDELVEVTNSQRTSTRGGILKAEASILYAQVLSAHEVETLSDATSLLADPDKLAAVDADLAKVPGDGHHGIRRGYLWMLVGDDDRIKPDRMVRRWFSDLGVPVDPQLAKDYILAAAPVCSEQLDRKVTPWEIDHAIWLAARR